MKRHIRSLINASLKKYFPTGRKYHFQLKDVLDRHEEKQPRPKKVSGVGRRRGRKREMVDGRLECIACLQVLSLTEFYVHKRKDTDAEKRYDSRCNDCRKLEMVSRRLGILPEAYRRVVAAANGKCCICTRDLGRPSVDHCHKTGRIRGALCAGCNQGLGCFRDSVDLLRHAAVYLESHGVKAAG